MQNKIYSYENFDIDVNGTSMPLIIWGIYIGIVLGVLGSILCRIYSSRIIQQLAKNGAVDPASAKTLAELGLGKQFLVRYMLKDDSSLRRSVLVGNPDELRRNTDEHASKFKKFWYEKFLRDEIPQKTDLAVAKFYLPEEKRIGAELRYQVEGHPIRNFVIAAVGLFAVAYFANMAIPELLQMLDNFITTVTPESKYL